MRPIQSDDGHVPIGTFLHAEAYKLAAEQLVRDSETGLIKLRFNSPIYHLFSHAIETVLKSFLLTKGCSPQELSRKPYGHNLEELYAACLRRGLRLGRAGWSWRRDMIQLVNHLHDTPYVLRYHKVGLYRIPTDDALMRLCKILFEAIRPSVDPRPIPRSR